MSKMGCDFYFWSSHRVTPFTPYLNLRSNKRRAMLRKKYNALNVTQEEGTIRAKNSDNINYYMPAIHAFTQQISAIITYMPIRIIDWYIVDKCDNWERN